MMGRRTPVIAIGEENTLHYRSLTEAAEDNGVTKVDIWRAIRSESAINGYQFDYEYIKENLHGNQSI
jgi:2-oxoglutarate dehydrogenase complex dehydrogenase (E1) component-like enzyme